MTQTPDKAAENVARLLDGLDQRAVNALYQQDQLDQDGVMVGVSREALDHVLSHLPPHREFASDEDSVLRQHAAKPEAPPYHDRKMTCPACHHVAEWRITTDERGEVMLVQAYPKPEATPTALTEEEAMEVAVHRHADRPQVRALLAIIDRLTTPTPPALQDGWPDAKERERIDHVKKNLQQWINDEAFHTIAGYCGDLVRIFDRIGALASRDKGGE